MRTVLILCWVLILSISKNNKLNAQESILDSYVKEGLSNNLLVTQKGLSIAQSANALAYAKRLYLPTIGFDLMYSTAVGGRSIDLPVGDMLNPVYQTLNQLTHTQAFPAIDNQKIRFLPHNYYDAKIRTSMPVYNTDIRNNKEIQEKKKVLSENELEIYRRELVKEIKTAYYNYLSATAAVAIYENAIQLATEGKRVNQKLLEAGKGLPAYVIRANAEIAEGEAKLAQGLQQQKNALLYFNMLLNRDEHAEIRLEDEKALHLQDLLQSSTVSIVNREEIASLATAIEIQEKVLKMNKQVSWPKVSAFLDLGSQAEGLKVNKNSSYYMVGAQLNVPIFTSGRNRLKVEESRIAIKMAQNTMQNMQQKINLSAEMAKNDLIAQYKNYESAGTQLAAAGTYQRLILRGFQEGVNTYIETVDARTQYTNAQLAYQVAAYKVLTAQAHLERETSSYPLQ